MHPHSVHNFKKRKRGYLCNFMKGSHEIKKLYGSAGRGYGVEEEFVPLGLTVRFLTHYIHLNSSIM